MFSTSGKLLLSFTSDVSMKAKLSFGTKPKIIERNSNFSFWSSPSRGTIKVWSNFKQNEYTVFSFLRDYKALFKHYIILCYLTLILKIPNQLNNGTLEIFKHFIQSSTQRQFQSEFLLFRLPAPNCCRTRSSSQRNLRSGKN